MAGLMNTAADTLADAMRKAATTLRPAFANSRPAIAEGSHSVLFAVSLIESNEGPSDNKFGDAAQCIMTNPTIAAVYISMTNPAALLRT